MCRETLLYEGKAKQIFATEDPGVVKIRYKDEATAFNGEKRAQIAGKGALNNTIAALLFTRLADRGIPSHFICKWSTTEQLVKKVDIVPLEVVVRNIAAGSLTRRIGLEEGTALSAPIVEFYYKNDELNDPLLNKAHIRILDLATEKDLEQMKATALRVNEVLKRDFAEKDVCLVDFKLEFGRDAQNRLLLADEISPDTCRFWDKKTNEKLDKDVFRQEIGSLTEAYKEILQRLGGALDV